MCNHHNCKTVLKDCKRGVGVLYVVDYHKRNSNGVQKRLGEFVLVGKERGGRYQGLFSVIGGKLKDGCWIKSATRETLEEAKLDISVNFDAEFRDPASGFLRWIFVNGTPQLVGKAPRGVSRKPLNTLIAAANADKSLPWDEQEMECVEFARLEADGKVRNPEGQELPASKYLVEALTELGKRRDDLHL